MFLRWDPDQIVYLVSSELAKLTQRSLVKSSVRTSIPYYSGSWPSDTVTKYAHIRGPETSHPVKSTVVRIYLVDYISFHSVGWWRRRLVDSGTARSRGYFRWLFLGECHYCCVVAVGDETVATLCDLAFRVSGLRQLISGSDSVGFRFGIFSV